MVSANGHGDGRVTDVRRWFDCDIRVNKSQNILDTEKFFDQNKSFNISKELQAFNKFNKFF